MKDETSTGSTSKKDESKKPESSKTDQKQETVLNIISTLSDLIRGFWH